MRLYLAPFVVMKGMSKEKSGELVLATLSCALIGYMTLGK